MFYLEYFSFEAIWSPVMIVITLLVAALYLLITGPLRNRFSDSKPVSWKKKTLFLVGLFLYYLAQGGPISLLAHLLLSGHMLSMAFSYFVAAPLMLLGTPGWLIRPFINSPKIQPVFKKLTHPIATMLMFNMIFSFYHLPQVMDFIMVHYSLHYFYFSLMLVTSLLMWWNILCPLPEWDRLTEIKKMGYIFASGALLTLSCALIIFASHPLYAMYSDPNVWAKALGYCVPGGSTAILQQFKGPEIFQYITLLEDQQFGGILMKMIQEISFSIALFYVFIQWFHRENPRENKIDPIPADHLA